MERRFARRRRFSKLRLIRDLLMVTTTPSMVKLMNSPEPRLVT